MAGTLPPSSRNTTVTAPPLVPRPLPAPGAATQAPVPVPKAPVVSSTPLPPKNSVPVTTGGTGTTGTANQGSGGGMLAGSDAQATLKQWLDSVGLGTLTTWAWQQITAGATPLQIEENIRQTPQWQQTYGPTILARQKAGLPPISEQDVINYKDTAQQLAQQYNLPPGVLSDDTLNSWIAQDKSTSELQQAIQQGYSAVETAPPEVRSFMSQAFGVGNGDSALAAYFMDPTANMPALLQQAQAAQIGGAGTRAGVQLSGGQAMTLAQYGVTTDRAQSGFSDIDKLAPVFAQSVGEANTGQAGLNKAATAVGDIVGDAATADQLQQRVGARVAGAQGKVGVEENPQKGFEGLGEGF